MFWRFGGYANVSTIDTLLEKPDTTLEELLDDADLLQELKQHNAKLIEYLREENVLHRLLQYIVSTKPFEESGSDDDGAAHHDRPGMSSESEGRALGKLRADDMTEEEREKEEKTRLKYANIACEILSSETRSITDTLMEHQDYLREFWLFLEREPPLDPLEAGYFTKVNETLLDRKTEEMLSFVKTMDDVVWHMLRHVDCPVVMDLLLKMISLEGAEGGQGIVDWLQSRDLIPILLSYLSADHPSATQTSAGDFLKAIITISANASQNEQSCIGPNSLTRQLVSEACIGKLIKDMLRGGCALTVGVGVIIEVIRKNNSDYDPDIGVGLTTLPSSKDPIYLGTLLRMFAQSIPDFMDLILNRGATGRTRELPVASGEVIEPLGFDRFKTCELMAELLHCSNMGLLNEPGSEAYVRQRDQERERLRAEGILPHERESRPPADFADDSSSYPQDISATSQAESSPEEPRRLEVSNPGDEDGFEDIVISEDLDDVRDDFGDRDTQSSDNAGEEGSQTGHSSGGASDHNGPGQPPGSPGRRMVIESDSSRGDASSEMSSSESPPASRSPTSDIATRMEKTHLEGDDEATASGSPSARPAEEQERAAHAPPPLRLQDVYSTPPADHESPPSPSQLPLPSSPPPTPTGLPPISDQISPHPEDHPAPLFSRPAEPATLQGQEKGTAPASNAEPDNSTESIDTTFEEEGDSIKSVLTSGTERGLESRIEPEPDSSPVVGDYLKMMFVEHRVVPTILDFFFRFSWNNFLHNVVYDVVQQVFNGPMDRGYNRTLAIDLFERGRVTEKVVEGQRKSDEAQARTNMRLGYMGHLTLIAEEVVKFTERHPPEFLSKSVLEMVMAPEWVDYVEHSLAETRERDNAILGGVRPDVSVGARQAVMNSLNAGQNFGNGPSTALANAGLTGGAAGLDTVDLIHGNGNPNENFSFGGNALLSGFGASDEDDEDMDEESEVDEGRPVRHDHSEQVTEEHTGMIRSNPNDVVSETEDKSDAPRIPPPPPPPPLNIPPSRARRQLAARLAMKLKAKQEEQRTGDPGPSEEEEAHDGSNSGYTSSFREGPSLAFDSRDAEDEPWSAHRANRAQSSSLSSSSSSSSSSSDEDDEDIAIAPPLRPVGFSRSSATPAATRSLLESEDDEDEGEVVDFGNGDNDGMSSEDSGDLVEIQTMRKTEAPGEEYRAHHGLVES